MRLHATAIWGALGLGLASGWAQAAPAPITVFAAASLKNSVDAVDDAYARATGQAVRASYGASSTLARQIDEGAPAQVFVSADTAWMDDVQSHGLVTAGSRRDLLGNHLALIAPAGSTTSVKIGPGFPLVQALGGGRLAMAAPAVPAGRYGRQALTKLGVWTAVEPKVVYAENVRAALAFVDHGEAPLGVVYDTDAKIDPGVRLVGLFPDDSHPPIVYPAALIGHAASPAAASYLKFLEGPQAAAIFRRFGFTVLSP